MPHEQQNEWVLPHAVCRMRHRVEHFWTFSALPLMAQWNYQQFHLRAEWNYKYERDPAYTRMKIHAACGLLPALCALRPAAHRPDFHACVLAGAFINTSRQQASEIAGNYIAPLVEMQRKFKYVQLGSACGMRQSMNRPLLFCIQ